MRSRPLLGHLHCSNVQQTSTYGMVCSRVTPADGRHGRPQVTKETGVERVVVERETSVVRIVGKSREAVQNARRQLEITSVEVRERAAMCAALRGPFAHRTPNPPSARH
jgi:hypothetical protein